MPIMVKARDGVTDLYGLMYKPTHLDPAKKSDRQSTSTRDRRPAASAAARSFRRAFDTQALAELGFVVVEIDGMGTPWRSKKFHVRGVNTPADLMPSHPRGVLRQHGR